MLRMLTVVLKEMVYSWWSVALMLWVSARTGEGNDASKLATLLNPLTRASTPADRICALSHGMSLIWAATKPEAESVSRHIPWAFNKSLADEEWEARFVELVRARVECALEMFISVLESDGALWARRVFLCRKLGDGTVRESSIVELDAMVSILEAYQFVAKVAMAAADGAEDSSGPDPATARSPASVAKMAASGALREINTKQGDTPMGSACGTLRSRTSTSTATKAGKRARPSTWLPSRARAPPPPHAAI